MQFACPLRSRFSAISIVTAILLVGIGAARAADNWPQLRGPQSLGVGRNRQPARQLDRHRERPLEDRRAGPRLVVADRLGLADLSDHVPSTRATPSRPRRACTSAASGPSPRPPNQWNVLCLDLNTGKTLWDKLAHEGPPAMSIHLKNSYASETPVTDGQRVYAYFGNVGVFCYDLDGNAVWSKDFTPHKMRFGWGTAASPVLYKDRLYIVNDNDEEAVPAVPRRQDRRASLARRARREEQLGHALHLGERAADRDHRARHAQEPLVRSGRQAAVRVRRQLEHHHRHALLASSACCTSAAAT